MAVHVHVHHLAIIRFFPLLLFFPELKKNLISVPTFTSFFFINPSVKNTSKHYDLHAKVTVPKYTS